MLLQNNPDIAELALDISSTEDDLGSDFRDFLHALAASHALRSLQRFQVGVPCFIDAPWSLSPESMVHFHSLTSLEITGTGMIYGMRWELLQQEGVRLQEIVLCGISESFLNYMSSYSGIRKFHFKGKGHLVETGLLANIFYQSALPRHRVSLEDLAVLPGSSLHWLFEKDTWEFYTHCPKLRTLDVSLALVREGEPRFDYDLLPIIFNYALVHSHLEQIRIRAAHFIYYEQHGGTPAFFRIEHLVEVTDELVKEVCESKLRLDDELKVTNDGVEVAVHRYEGDDHCFTLRLNADKEICFQRRAP
ncbi:hypothetical protein V5O48_004179 [Marasmius crinis-equi]|uniref:Uncharacterized protein n=1 Tax=Marasmius crinis-equi TaxID=585013 RepID=A0ABR3FQY9_9AGAR